MSRARKGGALHIYTDGACLGNGKRGAQAGYGLWYGHDDPRNANGPVPGAQTNQRAELEAVRQALEEEWNTEYPICIVTDSEYAIKSCTTWLAKWKGCGWKNSSGKSVANLDIIRDIDQLLEQRPGRTLFKWVQSHSGDEGNEAADTLARQAALCVWGIKLV